MYLGKISKGYEIWWTTNISNSGSATNTFMQLNEIAEKKVKLNKFENAVKLTLFEQLYFEK